MSQNLKASLQEETPYSARKFVEILAAVIPGRSVGDRYVVETAHVDTNSFVTELDDGTQFKITCEKLN